MLSVGGLFAWQLVVAGPAYAKAGDLDSTFGVGGKVTTDIGGVAGPDQANALTVQADGKLVAAGSAFSGASFDFNFALARYNSDGTLDTSFGIGGKVTTDFVGQFFSGNDRANALAVQADGKLVAAGVTEIPGQGIFFALARYTPDGTLDPTFGTGGKVTTRIADVAMAFALAAQADGKLVTAGWAAGTGTGGYDFALARYNTDGSLDTGFGTGGTVTTDFGGGQQDEAHALVVQADGKLVAAGSGQRSLESSSDFALARYTPDGTLDPRFGTGGKVTTNMGVGFNLDEIRGLVAQGDGKLVAAGFTFSGPGPGWDFGLVRYRTNGVLDATFGTRGKVITDFASGDEAFALALQADGKLVAAGSAITAAGLDFALARYRS
jgi:uncharacterized delta-60 repeat protein